MAFILRILRALLPLFFFYIVGKVFRNFIEVYQYQQRGRGNTGPGYGDQRSGGDQSFRGSQKSSDPYEILGCSRSSSNEEIKKKYRERIAKYHPDRFVGMSLDDDFVKLASVKFQEIQSAYEIIRKSRGF